MLMSRINNWQFGETKCVHSTETERKTELKEKVCKLRVHVTVQTKRRGLHVTLLKSKENERNSSISLGANDPRVGGVAKELADNSSTPFPSLETATNWSD